MHLGTPALLDFYRRRRDADALVLATIIGTEGSTYRKPGAMMLIDGAGEFEGMISGGCLEGDLLQHAEAVFADGATRFVTYDMHADESLVWGLGLGCDGVIHLMLQRLDGPRGFAFLEALDAAHQQGRACTLALAVAQEGAVSAGALALADSIDISIGESSLRSVLEAMDPGDTDWRCRSVKAAGGTLLLVHFPPPVRVLVCGAGPDAVPVAEQLARLDWRVDVVDHRPAYARPERFPGASEVIRSRPEHCAANLDLDAYDAAVIMSHHLENDASYLSALAGHPLSYIGVLGPVARRERLREMAEFEPGRLYGPVGLDIGAELPEAIALSIAAEIHAVLNGRNGHALTEKCNG